MTRYTWNRRKLRWQRARKIPKGCRINPAWVNADYELDPSGQFKPIQRPTGKRYRLLQPGEPKTLEDPEHPGLVLVLPGESGYRKAPFEEVCLFATQRLQSAPPCAQSSREKHGNEKETE